MADTIIDATDLILGRLASNVAKRLIKKEKLIIVNAEKAVISGNKDATYEKYRLSIERGEKYNGPFYPRMPDLLVRRTIRGMLPYKIEKGKTAMSNLKVFIGVPEELKGKKFQTIEEAKKDKLIRAKTLSVEKISKHFGADF